MINFPFEKIKDSCAAFNLELDAQATERLQIYANLLIEWNEKINLTAITQPDEVVFKHFYDCMLFFKNVDVPKNSSLIDVGTGAGFPGLVLKAVRPDIELTLLDSLNKRIIFLNDVLEKTGLTAKTVHGRAEEKGQKADFREKYDFSTARAVAPMNVLYEYCLPFVKKDGSFVALKGPSAEDELDLAKNALRILGGSKPVIFTETLTGEEIRKIIITKKISQTPTKYPRISAKISKQPL